jgi:hypothetical protein
MSGNVFNPGWDLIGELGLEAPYPEEEVDVEATEEGQEHQQHQHGSLLTTRHHRSSYGAVNNISQGWGGGGVGSVKIVRFIIRTITEIGAVQVWANKKC